MRLAASWPVRRRTGPIDRRRAVLAVALLSLPLALRGDQQAGTVPVRDVMPSCFAAGPVLWREARGQSLVCTPTGSAAEVRPGSACWRVYLHPVTFVVGTGGSVEARFALADGATAGTLPVEAVPHEEAFVVDTRLGSDEATSPSGVACRLASTLHFYCPTSGMLDHLCLSWRGSVPGDGGVRAACGSPARWPPHPSLASQNPAVPTGAEPQSVTAPGRTP
jgi:hypothetical protein